MAGRFRNDKRYISWLLQQKRKRRQEESAGNPPPVEPIVPESP